MNLYICTDHDVHWPVGGASIVIANSIEEARDMLDVELIESRLKPYSKEPYTLKEIDLSPKAIILNDGDY